LRQPALVFVISNHDAGLTNELFDGQDAGV
jgi:hypothetical protein